MGRCGASQKIAHPYATVMKNNILNTNSKFIEWVLLFLGMGNFFFMLLYFNG